MEDTYPQLRVSAPGRVIAIGDLHGDIGQARRALRLAGVLGEGDESGNPTWVGGDTTVVQVGDILDRGDDEIGILILLQKLEKEARKQGGGVYVLNGNHEVLNVSGDFRYVSRGAFGETMRFSQHLVKLFGDKFRDAFGVDEKDSWTRQSKARIGLFSPGGPLAQQMSMNHTVLIVNDTVFAHGGLVPRHVEFGLDKLNRAVTDWMRGKEIKDNETRQALGMAIGGVRDSIVWHRGYGTERFATDEERSTSCALLGETLGMIDGANRLVVGHTLNSAVRTASATAASGELMSACRSVCWALTRKYWKLMGKRSECSRRQICAKLVRLCKQDLSGSLKSKTIILR